MRPPLFAVSAHDIDSVPKELHPDSRARSTLCVLSARLKLITHLAAIHKTKDRLTSMPTHDHDEDPHVLFGETGLKAYEVSQEGHLGGSADDFPCPYFLLSSRSGCAIA